MQETLSSLGGHICHYHRYSSWNSCGDYLIHLLSRMSRPASEILQKFYLRLRDHSTSADGTPITARQLESLVRLAEAHARLELREEITAQDAMVY